MDIYQKFGPGSFAVIERKLARGEFIAEAELALVLDTNPDVPLPPAIRDYLIRTLQGKVKAPRGRKSGGYAAQFRDLYAINHYERYLTWLRARKRRLV